MTFLTKTLIRKLSDRILGPFRGNTLLKPAESGIVAALCLLLLFPPDYLSIKARAEGTAPATPAGMPCLVVASDAENAEPPALPGDRTPLAQDSTVYADAEILVRAGEYSDSIPPTEVTADDYPYGLDGKKLFNPSPTRAVWLSALFPGLGQIYNRRYWKLPIVVGGFMGLGYATNWNNNQYQDYMQGYRDLLDSDPGTKSYMNFFPPTVNESDLDKEWLTRTFKSRKDYFRRNRDLCIICLVALYLVCMVDAYIDASMAHFDISPNLSLDWSPALIVEPTTRKPSIGLNWAFNF